MLSSPPHSQLQENVDNGNGPFLQKKEKRKDKQQQSSGKIGPCHGSGPGSIPGYCILSLLFVNTSLHEYALVTLISLTLSFKISFIQFSQAHFLKQIDVFPYFHWQSDRWASFCLMAMLVSHLQVTSMLSTVEAGRDIDTYKDEVRNISIQSNLVETNSQVFIE